MYAKYMIILNVGIHLSVAWHCELCPCSNSGIKVNVNMIYWWDIIGRDSSSTGRKLFQSHVAYHKYHTDWAGN